MSQPATGSQQLKRKVGIIAIYLYCLTLSRSAQPVDGMGVDGNSPVVIQPLDGVSAVISEIPAEEFCGALSETHLKDLSWVGPRAGCHERVIEQVMRSSPVMPAQFGTLFSSLEGLNRLVEQNRPVIEQFLEYVADKEEWSVKVYLDRAKGMEMRLSEKFADESGRLQRFAPGQRYIHEQRLKMGIAKELNRWIGDTCHRIEETLCEYTVDHRERRLISRDVSGESRDMFYNWAFLVPRSSLDAFAESIARINEEQGDQGLTMGLSGPWPPYSFSPAVGILPG